MKKIIALIGVAALLATISISLTASAQSYDQDIIQLPLVQANMTSNLLSNTNQIFLDYRKQQNCGMQFNDSWSAGVANLSNTNAIYLLAPTYDGTTFSTNNITTITVIDGQSAAGAVQRWSTNLVANGQRGWIIYSIQNNHSTGILTNNITRGTKILAP